MNPARWRIRADRSGRGSGKRAIPRTALPLDFDGPPSSVKNPPGSGKITGGSRVWPTHDPRDPRAVTRTLLISGYRFGLTTPGSRSLLPGRRMGCRMQPPATDKPSWSALVSVGLLLTWDIPAVGLSCTSRDGTDDGERSKRLRYLRSPDDAVGAPKASSMPR